MISRNEVDTTDDVTVKQGKGVIKQQQQQRIITLIFIFDTNIRAVGEN